MNRRQMTHRRMRDAAMQMPPVIARHVRACRAMRDAARRTRRKGWTTRRRPPCTRMKAMQRASDPQSASDRSAIEKR